MGKRAENNSIFCYSRLLLGSELYGLDGKADQPEVQLPRVTEGVYPSSCGLLYSGKLLNSVQENARGKNESFLGCLSKTGLMILCKDLFHAYFEALKSNIPLLFVVLIGITAPVI